MSRQVTGRTGLLCLLGSPVAHSISPAMHNEACALLDLDYTYLAFDVAPDRLAEAVEGLKALGVRGFNVTMPHKTAAAALCERLSPAAGRSTPWSTRAEAWWATPPMGRAI